MSHTPSHRKATHRKATPPNSTRQTVVAVVCVVALIVTAVAILLTRETRTTIPNTPPPSNSTPVSVQQVDVTVAHTLVAASRLDAFAQAAQSRRAVVLERAHEDLSIAQEALAEVSGKVVDAPVKDADEALDTLMGIVTDLQDCVADKAADKSANPTSTTGARKTPTKGSSKGSNNQSKDKKKSEKAASPEALCAVSADEVEAARAAGASVAALIPYGALTTGDLATLNLSVKGQVLAEALEGSDSTVVLPDRYAPLS
jgi:hypothetical protein